MRVTKQQALENRTKILTEAARLVRERGLSGIGVDALTEAAGLTHGSLYSHFSSKDHLMAEALAHGFTKSGSQANGVGNVGDVISAYLSAAHRDNPGRGCFVATLGCEMPRQTKTVRRTFTQGVRGNIARLAALLPARRGSKRQDEALTMIITMVGAMVLARAVNDPKLSNQILSLSRSRLLANPRRRRASAR